MQLQHCARLCLRSLVLSCSSGGFSVLFHYSHLRCCPDALLSADNVSEHCASRFQPSPSLSDISIPASPLSLTLSPPCSPSFPPWRAPRFERFRKWVSMEGFQPNSLLPAFHRKPWTSGFLPDHSLTNQKTSGSVSLFHISNINAWFAGWAHNFILY